MPETIQSIVQNVLDNQTPNDREILKNIEINRIILKAINEDGEMKRALTLPGESDLNTLDFNRKIETENHANLLRCLVSNAIHQTIINSD